MPKKIVGKKKFTAVRLIESDIEFIQNYANQEHEGNFSRALREIIKLGIKAVKK